MGHSLLDKLHFLMQAEQKACVQGRISSASSLMQITHSRSARSSGEASFPAGEELNNVDCWRMSFEKLSLSLKKST